MEKFHQYTPEDVIYANLQESAQRIGLISEQEIAHLSELASELVHGIDGSLTEISSAFDFLPKHFFKMQDTPPVHAPLIQSAHTSRSVWLDVVLCREIQKKMKENGKFSFHDFFVETDELSFDVQDTVAYQKNSYADAAFLRFSTLLKNPRTRYTSGFPSACEDVFNGRSEFCILPLENSSEGILNSFLRLIDRYKLHICAICDITSADHTRTTKFALLRRMLKPFRLEKDVRQYLEISSLIDDSPSPAEILTAAQLCSLGLFRIDTYNQQSDGQEKADVHFLFDVSDGDFSVFLLYLTMRARNIVWRGLYPHL